MRRVTGLILAVLGVVLVAAAILLPTYRQRPGRDEQPSGQRIGTYVFKEYVAPAQVTTITVPGAFFHLPAKTVTLPEMYEIHLTYWVDPRTGALLNVNEDEKVALQNPANGATVAVLARRPRNDTDPQRSSSRAASSR